MFFDDDKKYEILWFCDWRCWLAPPSALNLLYRGTRTQWWCRTVLGMAEAGMTAAEEEVFDAALAAHASQLEASGDAAAAASSGSGSSSSGERPAPLPLPADLEHFAQIFRESLAAIQARNRTGTSGRIAACDTHRRYATAELSARVLRKQLPSVDDLTHLRLPLAAKYGEAGKWPAAFAAWAAR